MSDMILLFIIVTPILVFPFFIIGVLTPRLVFPMTLIICALYHPILFTELKIMGAPAATLLLGFAGAIAIICLIIPKLQKRTTLFKSVYRTASLPVRFLVIFFTGMVIIATVSTLVEGEPAVGTAVFIAIWVLASAAGFQIRPSSSVYLVQTRFFILKATIIMLVAALVGVWLTGGGSNGRIDVILSVMALAALALTITPRFLLSRCAMFIVTVVSVGVLIFLFPNSQSLHAGVLFGAIWMYIILSMRRTGTLAGGRRLLAIVVVISILFLPVCVVFLHQGRHIGMIEGHISWMLNTFGESMTNLMDRPMRWEVLFAEIQQNPFNLGFTDFTDTMYLSYWGWQIAWPHNILITTGTYFGILGMVIALILTVALINSLIGTIIRSTPQFLPLTLGAFGIVCALLFRNMWSNALFSWPVEIMLFSLAVLAAWQAERVSSKVDLS